MRNSRVFSWAAADKHAGSPTKSNWRYMNQKLLVKVNSVIDGTSEPCVEQFQTLSMSPASNRARPTLSHPVTNCKLALKKQTKILGFHERAD